jgi:two-component system, chemotaxis family, sensor kinase CheA
MHLDLGQFHAAFFEESFEALDSMETALLKLDVGAPDPEGVSTVFRVAHSIKGGAGMFGFKDVASFTHTLETLLDELRSGRMQVTTHISDQLLISVDVLRSMLGSVQRQEPVDMQKVADLQFDLEQIVANKSGAGASSTVAAVTTPAPVAVAAPTPPPAPAASAAPAPEPPKPTSGEPPKAAGSEHSSIRVGIEKIDELINTVGELVITQAMLSELGRKLEGPVAEPLRSGLTQLERNMRELQESVMRVRMLPISFTFSRFPRMVRDLAQRLGKQIELKMTGEHTELDKTVLEKIGDPLVHLVRNSVDHGIEPTEKRIAAGKSAVGVVHLDACHRGGSIAVEIRDDGGGLDKSRILAKARSRGLVGANDVLTDEQIHELIFLPGFSTAEKTTDVSGRGVGMDVVRRNVKELGGKIEIHSELGKGSRFIITLPLTLAIVDGQSVSVGGETYIVPLTSIIESLQLQAQTVSKLSGRGEVFSFRGDYLPIVRLHEVFGVTPKARALHEGLIVVAEGDGRRIGLFVDELLGQQQVVIKSMEANYAPIDGVAGATILGDGSVALILDLPGLIRVAARRIAA